MTEQLHCNHEKICRFFLHDSKVAVHDGTPCMRNHDGCARCSYDSRNPPNKEEYRISEEQLKKYENGGYNEVILREIRSRPLEEKPCDHCDFQEIENNLYEAREKGKKEGREKTLNEMRDVIRNTKKAGTIEPEEMFHWTGIIAIIDELRGKEK
jgi:hypothetical protein